MAIGAKLKELRIKHSRSLQEVADAVGASKAHIWDLEKGNSKNPSMELLTNIADYFKTSVAELVGEDPNGLNEEPEMVALYRDLKKLDPRDRDTIKTLVDKFKTQKSGDG